MNKKVWITLHSLLLAVLLFSCASSKFEGDAVLVGRVYDSFGRGVSGYHISAGFAHEAISDKTGVFSIPNVSAGTYKIHGGANGWQSWEKEIEFYDRKEILCILVERLEELLPKIDSYLSEGQWEEARGLLEKSKKHNERNPLFLSMQNLIVYCQNPSEESKQKFLSSLEKM